MTRQTLNGRILGEQTAPTRFLGPDLGIALRAAAPEEEEETLVSDPRGDLSPSQIVEQRLTALLAMSRPKVFLDGGHRLFHLCRARNGQAALRPGSATSAPERTQQR